MGQKPTILANHIYGARAGARAGPPYIWIRPTTYVACQYFRLLPHIVFCLLLPHILAQFKHTLKLFFQMGTQNHEKTCFFEKGMFFEKIKSLLGMHETSTERRVFLKKKEPLLGMPGTVDRLGYQIIIQKKSSNCFWDM